MPRDESLLTVPTSSKDKPANSKYYEDVARILVLNPAMLSLFFGMGINVFLEQFLKIWPNSRREALPYISIPTVILAGVGWKIGADSIRYPDSEIGNSPIKRTAMASMEGIGFILPFFLLNLFQIYCHYFSHLDAKGHCEVSDEIFWKDFFTAPAILGALFVVWNAAIDPAKKRIWVFPKEEEKSLKSKVVKKSLAIGADILSLMLFYSRIIQTAMFIYLKPTPLLCEGVAAPATLIALAGEIFQSQHRQKIDTVMRLLMNAGLVTYFMRAKIDQQSFGTQWYHSWSLMLEFLSFSSLLLAGVFYTARHGRQYFEERSKIPYFVPINPYSFPIQQKTSAEFLSSWKDPQEKERVIDTMLADDEDLKRRISKKLNINQNQDVRVVKEPTSMQDIMEMPNHEAILAIIMRDFGFEPPCKNNATDELRTIGDEDGPSTMEDGTHSLHPSASKFATVQQIHSTANVSSALPQPNLSVPLLFAGPRSSDATDDIQPSTSKNASPPKRRR